MKNSFSPDSIARASRPFYDYDRAWMQATTEWELLYSNETGSGMVRASLAFNNITASDATASVAMYPGYVAQLPPSDADLDANMIVTEQPLQAKELSAVPLIFHLRAGDSLWVKASANDAINVYAPLEEEQ